MILANVKFSEMISTPGLSVITRAARRRRRRRRRRRKVDSKLTQ